MPALHRTLLAILLVGNTLAFAGVDPVTRFVTAILVVVLMVDLRPPPPVPKTFARAVALLAALFVFQLVPIPQALRALIQPGFSEVLASGWAPLSLAPWATIRAGASIFVVVGILLVAARMAATRSGLPVLLGILAVTCGLLGVLGLGGESGAPESVLLVRANTGGGDPYGPFVNSNHFATAVELTVPAALVLFAAATRNLARAGGARQRAAVTAMAAGVAVAVSSGALMRSGSRGGLIFLLAGVAITMPLWMRPRRSRRWPWVLALVGLVAVATALAWTRIPELQDGFTQLLVIDGVEGNTRWDLWQGTIASFLRSPLVGTGLGTYRFVIGLDKPATGAAVLEHAHNDWLEWASTTGLVGIAALALFMASVIIRLMPSGVRRLRFELRYPLAGAAAALVATGLHEIVGFGVQTPLNRYVLATWVGLVWGVWNRVEEGRSRKAPSPVPGEDAGSYPGEISLFGDEDPDSPAATS